MLAARVVAIGLSIVAGCARRITLSVATGIEAQGREPTLLLPPNGARIRRVARRFRRTVVVATLGACATLVFALTDGVSPPARRRRNVLGDAPMNRLNARLKEASDS